MITRFDIDFENRATKMRRIVSVEVLPEEIAAAAGDESKLHAAAIARAYQMIAPAGLWRHVEAGVRPAPTRV